MPRDRSRARSLDGAVAIAALSLLLAPGDLPAAAGDDRQQAERNRVSPALRIERKPHPPRTDRDVARPLDGYGNNQRRPGMNVTGTPLRRLLPAAYADGTGAMAGGTRPDPRTVSNTVFAQDGSRPNRAGVSDFVWQWGQFLDHDIDLTEGTDPPESVPIVIPADDRHFPPGGGMDFNRSIYTVDRRGVRQQLNEITGWIDASMVYGSDGERAAALRTLDGTGRLKVGPGNLLPRNVDGLPNAGGSSDLLFVAGDVRSNEQVGLTALHTLFVREHNRWANLLLAEAEGRREEKKDKPPSRQLYRYRGRDGQWVFSDRPPPGQSAGSVQSHKPGDRRRDSDQRRRPDGDAIYERARALVAAEIQHITYTEFLPALLGPRALRHYSGYRPQTDARLMNEFSTAAFRFGHSMLSPVLARLDAHGRPIAAGNLPLREAFFAPHLIREHGIEPLLRGLAMQPAQQVDAYVVDDVRNFLFGEPGLGGFDLVSLNIQRGRDHGLPDYNSARRALGLAPVRDFSDISSDVETVRRLASAYASVDEIDFWVGGLAEDAAGRGLLGELFREVVTRQFEALRDGDRFWYTRVLNREDRARIESLTLADIIRLNTGIGEEIGDAVFHVR